MAFDGRPGDPTKIDEAVRKKIAGFIHERVGDPVCPDHGKAATIICSGDSLDSVTFDGGCLLDRKA